MEKKQCDTADDVFQQRAELEVELAEISSSLFMPSAFFWTWDAQSDNLHVNRQGKIWIPDQGGAPLTLALLGEKWIHPDDRALFQESIAAACAPDSEETRFTLFFRMRDDSGYCWYLLRGLVIERDARGRGTRMVGLANDVESLRRLREQRTANTERMSFALEAARDGLWDWDTDSNEMYYSPRYITMLGYTPEEFPPVLSSWFDRVHDEDVEHAVRQQYRHVNSPAAGDMFESMYRFLAADGTYRWMLARAKVVQRDKSGRGRRVVGLHTDITELRAAQETLKDIVNYDHLTKVGSRFAFDARFDKLEAGHLPVSVIYMDVDALKLVNDSLGHEAGDGLLIKAAELIRGAFRSGDMVARIGGDEFIALLPRCPSHVAERLMENIRLACDRHNAVSGNMPIFLSLGLASTDQGVELFRLLPVADDRMMERKKACAEERFQILKHWLEEHSDRRISLSRHRRQD